MRASRTPIFDLLDNYKYVMQKMLSYEQILKMRKDVQNADTNSFNMDIGNAGYKNKSEQYKKGGRVRVKSLNKKNNNVVEETTSRRPRRQAARNASVQMGLQADEVDSSMGVMGENKNMHELVEPQRYFQERD